MQEFVIEAQLENLEKVNEFIQGILSDFQCSNRALMQLDLVVEEIFVNIASYAYPESTGLVKIQSEIKKDPLSITLTFIDTGLKYNPLANEDPDLTLSIEERQVGGLGIYLIKNMVDNISYDYSDGQNILTLTKNLN